MLTLYRVLAPAPLIRHCIGLIVLEGLYISLIVAQIGLVLSWWNFVIAGLIAIVWYLIDWYQKITFMRDLQINTATQGFSFENCSASFDFAVLLSRNQIYRSGNCISLMEVRPTEIDLKLGVYRIPIRLQNVSEGAPKFGRYGMMMKMWQNTQSLASPVNIWTPDAAHLAEVLKECGYEVVDLTSAHFRRDEDSVR